MAASNIDIIIQAQDKTANAFNGASSGLSSFKNKIDDLQPAFQNMAKVGTVAFGAVVAIAVSALKESAAAQADMAIANQNLENSVNSLAGDALKNLQNQAGGTANMISFLKDKMGLASEAALKLGFDDESASKSFAKLFQVTKDTAQANKELQLAMDMARAKNISLEDATQKLVMVHAGMTKALKAENIEVDENASALTNIDKLTKVYTGNAEAYANTSAGMWDIFTQRANNAKQALGDSLAPAFNKVLTAITPMIERFSSWAEQNPELLAKILMISAAIAGLVTVVGLIGMALPAIIAGFGLLSGDVGLIALAIGVVVAGFIAFKDQIGGIMAFLEDTGVLDYFRQIWDNISNTFQTTLLPAFQKLWDLLVKLKPFFEIIGQIVGGVLLVAIMALAKALEIIIVLFSNLLAVATKVATFMVEVFVKAFDVVRDAVTWLIDKFTILIQKIKDVIETAKEIGGNVLGSIGGAIGKIFKVNDAVVAPGGNVISTHPDDYIIATKDPSSLGGAGGLTININGGTYLDENVAAKIGDMLINTLNLNMRGS